MIADVSALALFCVVGNAMRLNTDFEKELAFYGSYHQDPINQAIHFVFIPIIWWSICVWMCYVKPFRVDINVAGHQISYGTFMLIIYCAYYVTLDRFTGGLFSLVLCLFYLQASSAVAAEQKLKSAKGKGKKQTSTPLWKIAFVIHAIAWFMQIVPGHKYAEGVKPALVDSLGQALGVAPLFAFLEGIWFVGLAPELKTRVLELVTANRAAMCGADGTYPWC
ncbi:hypothetical protein TL16_g06685 [Triparma laevis f. inornata]|uniref:Uncharacterized protein n=2 Tax=Triparma laevis TaxID=1534972 RepID=A0A9W7FD16_9STRA|nr:hypothetical protein TL16_g06685 [Triparma laevis f. inornata]GMI09911.1 hypothetical protein TrLO_g15292 [Triparma laevis f. longispina]